MASGSSPDSLEPIPLQDFSHQQGGRNLQPEPSSSSPNSSTPNPSTPNTQHQSLFHGGSLGANLSRQLSQVSRSSSHRRTKSHDWLHEGVSPSVPDLQMPKYRHGENEEPTEDQFRAGFEVALGGGSDLGHGSWLPPTKTRPGNRGDASQSPSNSGPHHRPNYATGSDDEEDFYVDSHQTGGSEDDDAPLASTANQQPIAGFSPSRSALESKKPSRSPPGSSLGGDLLAAEEGLSTSLSRDRNSSPRSRTRSGSGAATLGIMSRQASVSKSARSLSPGTSSVHRVSVALQNMSQRVVNLSNDPEAIEQTLRRKTGSSSPSDNNRKKPSIEIHPYEEISSDQEEKPLTPVRKMPSSQPWREQANPLKGNSLRIFSPNSRVRLVLCDILIHPVTEPLILALILVQTILLTIDSAPSVYNDPRNKPWGTSFVDYALLVLFVIYTVEIVARCIVSGLILNPAQPGDPNTRGGLRRRMIEKTQSLLSPHPPPRSRASSPTRPEDSAPSILRTITRLNTGELPTVSGSAQSQARFRLARRAFLRHSFNRLDFVAVISYWISLWLCISGVEYEKRIYVFRMMSCLRILRLLGITSGTSVILRSLKKAAPLLVNVAFLITFFWLVFAIIGVQSFKGSFRRACVWVDPEGIQSNFTQPFQFCGGWTDPKTGAAKPYLRANGVPGAQIAKGYICPKNSICVAGENPYQGTVSFDNIVQSAELVFVIMTANTFSNLVYYMADSDYLIASLFFIAGIIILAFWLANLLIAVITSSFQVIRDESSKSAFSADDVSSVQAEGDLTSRRPSTIKKFYDRTHHFWLFVIACGLLAQMFHHSQMSNYRASCLDKVEMTATIVLLFEILLRWVSDWRTFHTKRRNCFDLFFAVITTIMLLPPVHNSGRPYDWLTIFQILRIYRVVWAIPVTRNLLSKVLGNVTGLSNLLFFVIILTFICALFAVQIVRGDIPQQIDGNPTQITFYTIFNAFLGMYQIFSSENWTSILYTVTSVQKKFGVGWISAVFFIGWFILGNFIVLNMFIAVIQENFDVTEDEKRMHQVKAFLQSKSYKAPSQGLALSSIFSRKKKLPTEGAHSRQAAFEMLTKQAIVESFLDEGEQHNRQLLNRSAPMAAIANLQMEEEKKGRFFQRWYAQLKQRWKNREPNPFYSYQTRSVADLAPTALAQEVVTEQERRKKAQREYLTKYPNYNVSLFLFRPSNPIRLFCQRIVGPSRGDVRPDGLPPNTVLSFTFSIIIYCAIMAMVILACITTPLYQKEYFKRNGINSLNWFTLADTGFVVLFTLETIIKIIADGLIWTPNAYLRGSWGIIDCIVLISLWISVGSSLTKKDEISRAVGAFKALRALRLLNISGTAQDTFHSVVIVGGKKILSAAFVSMSLIIPFAIWGVNLFGGRLDICNDTSEAIVNLTDCIYEYSSSPFNWNVLAPRAVGNPYYNFDNFGTSLFILFQIVSQEGWTTVMFNAQAIVGKGLQPQPFYSQINSLFFVTFNLLGAVFVLTLFVSVFMRNYTEQTGVAFLTSDQRTWLELRKLLRQVRPSKRPCERPDADWKSWCYQRATAKHGYWQRGYTCLLMVHVFLLVLEYNSSPGRLETARDWMFLLLCLLYVVNIVVRVIGLTWVNFLKSKWDLYALITVSGTLGATFLLLAGFHEPMFMVLEKLFLVSIVISLIPRNDQLDHLFKTAAASLTPIGNLIVTWFVLFLVYAIALTQTFGLTRIGPNGNGNENFRTVPRALILLFQMTCGESWNEIMSDYEINDPYCVAGRTFFDSDCGSKVYANILFVSWNILSMYIFVSMFISLIFESFSYVYQRSGDSSQVSRTEIRKFKKAWARLDPDGDGYIPKDKFPRLLGLLSGIFAMRVYEEPFTVHSILEDVKVDPNSVKGLKKGSIVEGIDLEALNRKIARIPVHKIRRQRHIFTLFFEECLVSADKDYGVSFESVLLILAHYKIINDNKSLRLEEYLRRRYRLQRVEEQVQRNCVVNFFLTLYWNKRFREMKEGRDPAAVAANTPANVPTILVEDAQGRPSVPEIWVDTGNSADTRVPQITLHEADPVTPPSGSPPPQGFGETSGYSPIDNSPGGGMSFNFSFGGVDPFASPFDDGVAGGAGGGGRLRQRAGRRTPPAVGTPSSNVSPSASPLNSPMMAPTTMAGGVGGFGLVIGARNMESNRENRSGGEVVDPQQVMDALDSSEWRDQIREFVEGEVSRHGSLASSKKTASGPSSPSLR